MTSIFPQVVGKDCISLWSLASEEHGKSPSNEDAVLHNTAAMRIKQSACNLFHKSTNFVVLQSFKAFGRLKTTCQKVAGTFHVPSAASYGTWNVPATLVHSNLPVALLQGMKNQADGRLKIEDGRWKMEDGRWKIEDSKKQMAKSGN